jgi:hypothetical protein
MYYGPVFRGYREGQKKFIEIGRSTSEFSPQALQENTVEKSTSGCSSE